MMLFEAIIGMLAIAGSFSLSRGGAVSRPRPRSTIASTSILHPWCPNCPGQSPSCWAPSSRRLEEEFDLTQLAAATRT
jgi:hypothetical protein